MAHARPANCWLEFVGEGRSGHTVIAAILDAHPQVRISEEVKQISKWKRGEYGHRRDAFAAAHECGMGKERKKYTMSDTSQLTHIDPLLVLGDKCGWAAFTEFRKRDAGPHIFEEFSAFLRQPIKVIHSVRNPFDNIASWFMSPKYKHIWNDDTQRWSKLCTRYRRYCEAAGAILGELPPEDILVVYNEDLIGCPDNVISDIFEFLEVPLEYEQLDRYREVLFTSPNEKSKLIEWPKKVLYRVNEIIETHEFLKERYDVR